MTETIENVRADIAQMLAEHPELAKLAETRAWCQGRSASIVAEGPAPDQHISVTTDEARQPLTRERPGALAEMVGQEELRRQLSIVVGGARLRGQRPPHCLLTGPAGHGKTSLAGIIAAECGGELVSTSGLVLRRPEDLAGLVAGLSAGAVLFVDEVHRLPPPVMEMMYEALEDGTISLVVGKGAEAVARTFALPPFTCVGATTRPGMLAEPFRARFGFVGTVRPYSAPELAEIVRRAWERAMWAFAPGEPEAVAQRARGVPRLALHLADRVLDFAAVADVTSVTAGLSATALEAFGIDSRGLDRTDWQILEALVRAGTTIGVEALASALDLDPRTLTDQHEPGLVRAGLITRTKTGRLATAAAHELFNTHQGENLWP